MANLPLTPASSTRLEWFDRWRYRLVRLIGPLALLGPAGLWLFLLLVLPTLLILQLSLVPGLRPGQAITAYGLGNYTRILDSVYLGVIGRSLTFASGTMLLCLLLGFPVAYWIALMAPKRWRSLLLVLFILPLWTSTLLRTYAWVTLLRRSGIINLILSALHLPTQDIMNTHWAVYVGMTYDFLPYMVLILYASLEKLDQRLLEAAADLGANPRQTFWKVTVPQTLPGIAAGCLLVFVTSLGDFVVPTLLGGTSSKTISLLIYDQFLGPARNWGFGSALSMVLILAVSLAIALLLRYGNREAAAA
ncbi:ABC transporter permease [Romeria aff. gracilis LEGE 07310]|uniref:ABC transporter permease n=1 Tax=Vasconcelosia minhoensis LEGE 07310 TaxID=915328 RepID=A0A8J7AS51_9CYAN|nr:ABC transporter permease [Romeria gracilis]MBE9079314.1 ABC transporter permease [Romeria aff. gracilis LEGE 07310]